MPTSDPVAKVLEIDRLNCELALVGEGEYRAIVMLCHSILDRSIVGNGERKAVSVLLGIIRLLAGLHTLAACISSNINFT